MSQNEMDPTANTDKFRAFVEEEESGTQSKKSRGGVTGIAVALVGVLIVVAVFWLLSGG